MNSTACESFYMKISILFENKPIIFYHLFYPKLTVAEFVNFHSLIQIFGSCIFLHFKSTPVATCMYGKVKCLFLFTQLFVHSMCAKCLCLKATSVRFFSQTSSWLEMLMSISGHLPNIIHDLLNKSGILLYWQSIYH